MLLVIVQLRAVKIVGNSGWDHPDINRQRGGEEETIEEAGGAPDLRYGAGRGQGAVSDAVDMEGAGRGNGNVPGFTLVIGSSTILRRVNVSQDLRTSPGWGGHTSGHTSIPGRGARAPQGRQRGLCLNT